MSPTKQMEVRKLCPVNIELITGLFYVVHPKQTEKIKCFGQ